MTRGQHIELALYLEMLERDYGPGFDLSVLSPEELGILEDLLRYAIEVDPQVSEHDKLRLLPLSSSVREQQKVRHRYAWLRIDPSAAAMHQRLTSSNV
jgi:hypothetical protein